jgi:hypothetical protein
MRRFSLLKNGSGFARVVGCFVDSVSISWLQSITSLLLSAITLVFRFAQMLGSSLGKGFYSFLLGCDRFLWEKSGTI